MESGKKRTTKTRSFILLKLKNFENSTKYEQYNEKRIILRKIMETTKISRYLTLGIFLYLRLHAIIFFFIETIDILCEFLEVAIHNILYVRKLYPEAIFVPKRKYGVVAYQSNHPLVNEYITECLKAVEFHGKAKTLHKLVVGIVVAGTMIERYVFDVLRFQQNLEEYEYKFVCFMHCVMWFYL